jgi:arylsulfatase A-like enzyme
VKWPGKTKPGTQTDHVSAFWDFLPTFAEIVGEKVESKIDGISFVPTLKGESSQKQHEYLYWEFVELGGRQAIRKGDWKAVRLNVKKDRNAPIELYNLKDDPSESRNVATSNPELVKEMAKLFESTHIPNPVFKLFE